MRRAAMNAIYLLAVLFSTADAVAESDEAPTVVARIVQAIDDPATAIQLLRDLPDKIPTADQARLRELDRKLNGGNTDGQRALARELIATLARGGQPQSLKYLHVVFEASPERRHDVAAGIARFAMTGRRRAQDWRLLVRSLPVVEGEHARDVLEALQQFPQRGTKPRWQRQVILAGLRGGDAGADAAVALLKHWTRRRIEGGDRLAPWQEWFAEQHPDLPPPVLPADPANARHKYADLLALVSSESGGGDTDRGARVFERALCIKCHRFGERGEAMGPDLTNVRQRFQLKELLEATVFPSQAITDQYETTTVLTTNGRMFTGVLAASGEQLMVLQANGEKVTVHRSEVDEAVPNRQSSMPAGLLEPLTLAEIADLFAYMRHRD